MAAGGPRWKMPGKILKLLFYGRAARAAIRRPSPAKIRSVPASKHPERFALIWMMRDGTHHAVSCASAVFMNHSIIISGYPLLYLLN